MLLFRSLSCRLGVDSPTSPSEYNETPFFTSNHDGCNKDNSGAKGSGAGQFPFITFVVAAFRKSLVTCSVERQQVSSSSSSLDMDMEIGRPTDVEHVSHVTFDRFNGFLGLPLEFQPDFSRRVPSASASVFGVSPLSMKCWIDERGKSVPSILIMMQKCLYKGGGLQAEGIFRITAENGEEEFLRNQLNKGVVPEGIDVHCLAGLIKAWFRELPKGVLDCVSAEQVLHCNTEDECTELVNQLPPMEAALLDWAINLMADVVHNEHHNKMNARNIAMVFAPNMTHMADPLTALIHVGQVMNFLITLIVRTLRLRQKSAAEERMLSSYEDPLNPGTNLHPSMSIGDLIFEEKHHSCANQTHTTKLYRSITLDRLAFNKKNDEYGCFYGDTSPVTSLASHSKQESREGRDIG